MFVVAFVVFIDVWQQVLIPILNMRKEAGLINLFPQYITGEVSNDTTAQRIQKYVFSQVVRFSSVSKASARFVSFIWIFLIFLYAGFVWTV